MSEPVKVAIILCITALIIVAALLYFSPYQQCARANAEHGQGAETCLR